MKNSIRTTECSFFKCQHRFGNILRMENPQAGIKEKKANKKELKERS